MPANSHDDARHIVTMDLQGAADANGSTVPQVVGNIVQTLALYRGRTAGAAAMKGVDLDEVATKVLEVQPEQRFTLALGYPANKADVGRAADGRRDFVSAEVLEQAAWNYLREGARVGLLHADGTDGAGVVVESYIWRGPDWAIKAVDGSEVTIVAGDWLVGTIWDEVAWDAIKRRHIRGVSYQGRVGLRKPSAEALAGLRS